jgi:hypothetical protein
MAVSASCEPCGWRGKFENGLAGKRARCPDCGHWIDVPRKLEEDSGYEVIDEDESDSKPKKRERSSDADDRDRPERDRDEDDRDRRRRSRDDEDDRDRRRDRDDEDRNRRRRDRDEDNRDRRRRDRDEDDRPGRDRKPSRSGNIENRGTTAQQPLQGAAAIVVGILMMIGSVVWLVCGLAFQDKFYFYPPVLFVLGIITLVRGVMGSDRK